MLNLSELLLIKKNKINFIGNMAAYIFILGQSVEFFSIYIPESRVGSTRMLSETVTGL